VIPNFNSSSDRNPSLFLSILKNSALSSYKSLLEIKIEEIKDMIAVWKIVYWVKEVRFL